MRPRDPRPPAALLAAGLVVLCLFAAGGPQPAGGQRYPPSAPATAPTAQPVGPPPRAAPGPARPRNGPCTYSDTICRVGLVCPGGTTVSAACADRSAFGENPCACTAIEQLVGMSSFLPSQAPWNDLANQDYCTTEIIIVPVIVVCELVSGVRLPSSVLTISTALDGPMPRSIGDLGPALTRLNMGENMQPPRREGRRTD